MVGMQTQFGRGRYVAAITNRTIQSGGSVGGDKKPGIVSTGPSHPCHFCASLHRAPHTGTSLSKMLLLTTRNPVQYNRNGYYATHSGRLG